MMMPAARSRIYLRTFQDIIGLCNKGIDEKNLAKGCLDKNPHGHDECYYGLESLKAGGPYDRFSQAGQIILGEKNWWDF